MPNLTEKGQFAFNTALQHFKTQKFSAADLTAVSGEKVSAASLNAIVNKGYMLKEAGSPVKFYFVDNIDMILELEKNAKGGLDNSTLLKAKKEQTDYVYKPTSEELREDELTYLINNERELLDIEDFSHNKDLDIFDGGYGKSK